MNNILRHKKIAELLVIFWDANLASADEQEVRPDWTSSGMEDTVCNGLSQAVRGMLDADYNEFIGSQFNERISRSEFKEKVMEYLMDNEVKDQFTVSHAIIHVYAEHMALTLYRDTYLQNINK